MKGKMEDVTHNAQTTAFVLSMKGIGSILFCLGLTEFLGHT